MPRIKPVLPKQPLAKLPRELEARDIGFQAQALAKRAEAAGFSSTAYLLDMAALMLADELRCFGQPTEPRH
jgi:hypothetical protein